jgi:hypothetical protein
VPSRAQHLAKAESNQRLSLALQAGPHPDWSVTVLFYVALHLVEATLAPQVHSANHRDRFENVKLDVRLQAIHAEYRHLYELGLRSRYDCRLFTQAFVQNLYVVEYEPIKRHLQPLLGFTF